MEVKTSKMDQIVTTLLRGENRSNRLKFEALFNTDVIGFSGFSGSMKEDFFTESRL